MKMKLIYSGVLLLVAMPFVASGGEMGVDIPQLALAHPAIVGSTIGAPQECKMQPAGFTCFYRGDTEIVYNFDANLQGPRSVRQAITFTINDMGTVRYGKGALAALGLPVMPPTFSNANVMRWEQTIPGMHTVSLFSAGDLIFYAYITVDERFPHLRKDDGVMNLDPF